MQEAESTKKHLKKSEQIEVKIHEIKEQEFYCKDISDEHKSIITGDNIKIGFGVKFNTDPKQRALIIFFKTEYICDLNGEKCKLMAYELKVIFKIKNYREVVLNSDDDAPRIDENFLISMLGVVIGTARGMILVRTTGHFINQYYLPILNPQALFDAIVKSKDSLESK